MMSFELIPIGPLNPLRFLQGMRPKPWDIQGLTWTPCVGACLPKRWPWNLRAENCSPGLVPQQRCGIGWLQQGFSKTKMGFSTLCGAKISDRWCR